MTDLLAGLIFVMIIMGMIEAGKDLKKFEPMIGTNYNLNGKELIVVDYNFMTSNFTLSDGVKVHESLISP